jgi:nitroreductase
MTVYEAWKLIVVRDSETRQEAARACGGRMVQSIPMVATAPIVIVACNVVREADMRQLGPCDESAMAWTNMRPAGAPKYRDEYVEHSRTHQGEDESTGIWDLAIALDHLSLAAVGEGLGTCWVGGIVDEREIRRALAIPDDVQARMVMLLGYPDESRDPSPRKPLDEVVCYGRYA